MPAMIYFPQSKVFRCYGDVLEELDEVVMDSSMRNKGAIALRVPGARAFTIKENRNVI